MSQSALTLFQSSDNFNSKVYLYTRYLRCLCPAQQPPTSLYYKDIKEVYWMREGQSKGMVILGLVMVNSLFVFLLGVISLLMALLVPFSFLLIYTLYQSAKPYVVGVRLAEHKQLIFWTHNKSEAQLLAKTIENLQRQVLE
ncbi:MAG: hypothetical protein ACO3MZ_07380 [Flavobacteriaceae bacterium]